MNLGYAFNASPMLSHHVDVPHPESVTKRIDDHSRRHIDVSDRHFNRGAEISAATSREVVQSMFGQGPVDDGVDIDGRRTGRDRSVCEEAVQPTVEVSDKCGDLLVASQSREIGDEPAKGDSLVDQRAHVVARWRWRRDREGTVSLPERSLE